MPNGPAAIRRYSEALPFDYRAYTICAATENGSFTPAPEHTALEQFGGATSILQSAVGAIAENRFDDFLHTVGQGDFAEAKDQFAVLSKPTLDKAAKNNVPGAQFLRDAPAATATAQFLLDFLDPVQRLAGHGLGKVPGMGVKAVAATAEGRMLLSAFSPFRGLAANAGQACKRATQTMLVKMGSHSAKAQHAATDVFGSGLSREEQFDVVHIHQGNGHVVKTQDLGGGFFAKKGMRPPPVPVDGRLSLQRSRALHYA